MLTVFTVFYALWLNLVVIKVSICQWPQSISLYFCSQYNV
jgi:hypothetical protein